MTRDYELMIILHPELDAAGVHAALDALKGRIGQFGELTACDILSQRRLTYEVRGQRQGTYALLNFTADSAEVTGLRTFMQIQQRDQIIRYLLVIDEKRGARPPAAGLPSEDKGEDEAVDGEAPAAAEAAGEAETETEAPAADSEPVAEAPAEEAPADEPVAEADEA